MKALLKLAALVVDTSSWLYPFILAILSCLLTNILIQLFFINSKIVWLVPALPLIYLFWLFGFISTSAITSALLFINFQKPASLKVDLNFNSPQDLLKFID